MLKALLKFLESYATEGQLYFCIPARDCTRNFELLWRPDPAARDHWLLRPQGDAGEWRSLRSETLLTVLEDLDADRERFEHELQSTVLTQATYAALVLREAEALLGKEEVDRAIAAFKTFADQVLATVASCLPQSERLSAQSNSMHRNLRIVNDAHDHL